jgi:hypothetical protein
LSSLHLLRSRSLRQTRGGSVVSIDFMRFPLISIPVFSSMRTL